MYPWNDKKKTEWYKFRVERIAKAKGISMAQVSLAWIMSQEGMYFSIVFSFLASLNIQTSKGVTAPVVGTTSLENLYDLLGMFCISNTSFYSSVWIFFNLGAVDVKLTEEEKKELEAPYLSQAIFGHS